MHQLAHASVVGPQVDTLDENVVVIGVATAAAAIRGLAIIALRDCLVHAATPLRQLLRVEEVLDDDVAMFLIENDLFDADFVTHGFTRGPAYRSRGHCTAMSRHATITRVSHSGRNMLDKLRDVEARYVELERLLGDPATIGDYQRLTPLSKERAGLEELVQVAREHRSCSGQLAEARVMQLEETDSELRALAAEECEALQDSLKVLEAQLRLLLLPKDPRDERNVIMEIRAGAGGEEAGLFAADLFRMYSLYAEGRRWKVDVLGQNVTGVGGLRSITFEIRGRGAFSRLKFESGVHRVQRVPETESQGRIHTSTVTVAVLAEVDAVEVELNMNDVRVDVFRSQGAGGQSVNTTDSAVRMTHHSQRHRGRDAGRTQPAAKPRTRAPGAGRASVRAGA